MTRKINLNWETEPPKHGGKKGFKGSSFFNEPSYFYAPYVSLNCTRTSLDSIPSELVFKEMASRRIKV